MTFTESSVRHYLRTQDFILDIRKEVTSTNTLLKAMGRNLAPHKYVLAAEKQTAGRGRLGRQFYSPADTGLYFSVLLRPDLSPADSLLITTAAAVACARVLERISGKDAKIKWVNDVYIDGKKVCGILTEAVISSPEKIEYAVLGIGINITLPKDGFPADICHMAGAVSDKTEDIRAYLMAEILNEFFAIYPNLMHRDFSAEYRNRSLLDGLDVYVISPAEIRTGKALGVHEDFTLAVQFPDGSIEHISTGDVSVKAL